MTNWLLSLGWNWLLVPVVVWVMRGVWLALQRPELIYRSHSVVPTRGTLVTVDRQERWPPWRARAETWLVNGDSAWREVDGQAARKTLAGKLRRVFRIAEARAIETELFAGSESADSVRYAVLSFRADLSDLRWHSEESHAPRWTGNLAEAKVVAGQCPKDRQPLIVAVLGEVK